MTPTKPYSEMTMEELEAENQRLMRERAAIKTQMGILKPFYDAALLADAKRRRALSDPALWQGITG